MSRRPLMKDVCCGNGGWTKGFLAEGWDSIGYDIEEQPNYPGEFRRRNILDMTAADLFDADFVAVSTPCQQFSLFGLPMFFPDPPFPLLGIELFMHAQRICRESNRPFIMENVRAARKFVGPAVTHCGPFYFWGNAVPALFPPECRQVQKGLRMCGSAAIRKWRTQGLSREELTRLRRAHSNPSRWVSSSSPLRKEYTAKFSEIPFSISSFMARQFYPDHPIPRSPDLPIRAEVSA
jgi:hypothetical protein